VPVSSANDVPLGGVGRYDHLPVRLQARRCVGVRTGTAPGDLAWPMAIPCRSLVVSVGLPFESLSIADFGHVCGARRTEPLLLGPQLQGDWETGDVGQGVPPPWWTPDKRHVM